MAKATYEYVGSMYDAASFSTPVPPGIVPDDPLLLPVPVPDPDPDPVRCPDPASAFSSLATRRVRGISLPTSLVLCVAILRSSAIT